MNKIDLFYKSITKEVRAVSKSIKKENNHLEAAYKEGIIEGLLIAKGYYNKLIEQSKKEE